MCWSKKCHQNEPMAHSQHEASAQRATKNFGCDMCLLLVKFLRLPSMDTSYKVQNIPKPQVQYECIPPSWPRVDFSSIPYFLHVGRSTVLRSIEVVGYQYAYVRYRHRYEPCLTFGGSFGRDASLHQLISFLNLVWLFYHPWINITH